MKGGEWVMDEAKLNSIVDALVGLKFYEWSRVKVAVEKVLDQKYARLELDDPEKLRTNLKREIGAFDTNAF